MLRPIVRLSIEAGSDHWRLTEAIMMRVMSSSMRSGHGFLVIVIRYNKDVIVSLVLIGGRVEDDSLLGDLGVERGHAGPQRCRRGDQRCRGLGSQRVNEAVEALRPRHVL